jgi:hypothetical protein
MNYYEKNICGTVSIGDRITFTEIADKSLNFSICPGEIKNMWSEIDNLANLLLNFYQLNHHAGSGCIMVSMVLNELIENAVKYSRSQDLAINIDTVKHDEKLFIRVTNQVSEDQWINLMEICRKLFTENLTELFVSKIIENTKNRGNTGIGLIMLKKDFITRIRFVFRKGTDRGHAVSVITELDLPAYQF